MTKRRPARVGPAHGAKHAKATVDGAQFPASSPAPVRTAGRPLSDKYAQLSVFDPATGEVVAPDGRRTKAARGNTVTVVRHEEELVHPELPGPRPTLDRLYACEVADEETVARLAKLAGCSIAELESRRLDWAAHAGACPETVPWNRRRCITCPRWEAINDTPF